jgi:hypothetical protein
MDSSDLVGFTILALLFIVPIGAAMVISWRSRRRGWWLAAPGALFLVLWGVIVAFVGEADLSPRPAGAFDPLVAIAAVVSGWISLVVYLTALAAVGPNVPTMTLRDEP